MIDISFTLHYSVIVEFDLNIDRDNDEEITKVKEPVLYTVLSVTVDTAMLKKPNLLIITGVVMGSRKAR